MFISLKQIRCSRLVGLWRNRIPAQSTVKEVESVVNIEESLNQYSLVKTEDEVNKAVQNWIQSSTSLQYDQIPN